MSFSTLEDVNGTSFDNQGFWWHKIDTSVIEEEEYSDVVIDFCKVSREYNSEYDDYTYTIEVDNSLFAGGFRAEYNGVSIDGFADIDDNLIEFTPMHSSGLKLVFWIYLGGLRVNHHMFFYLENDVLNLTLKELSNPQTVHILSGGMEYNVTMNLIKGYNLINVGGYYYAGYLLVKLLKTDFQFDCSQSLIVGKVNTVQLGTLTDYKPNGDFVGEYATKLSVLYDGKTLPVVWNERLNDYVFNIDLTNETEEKKIRFKVIVEANEVLNHSETDVVLESKYETINTLTKLTELFRIGGTGRLGSDLTLNSDLTLTKDVLIIGNDKTLNLNQHKIVVPSERTFKAENTSFTNGVNSIQQYTGSTVDLTDCTFTNCTGMGSVIDCQVDIASLTDEDDFTTSITNCTFTNNDMCILHGGQLTVTDCKVNGKIGDKNYPYFLYQTDGDATLLQNEFSLIRDEPISTDIEFNSCIFVCGETAQINGYSHNELQANNLQNFLSVQRNTSKIDITYYYPSIDDYIHLQSDNGYCHSVSGVDFVFKTNINLSRGE